MTASRSPTREHFHGHHISETSARFPASDQLIKMDNFGAVSITGIYSAALPIGLSRCNRCRGDRAGELQQRINAAIASQAPSLSIAAGDYHFGNRTLLVQDASNLRLVAAVKATRPLLAPVDIRLRLTAWKEHVHFVASHSML